jgi:hypothetical protein
MSPRPHFQLPASHHLRLRACGRQPIDGATSRAHSMNRSTTGIKIFPREQQTPAALAAYHRAEIEKWWPILKAANIKAE